MRAGGGALMFVSALIACAEQQIKSNRKANTHSALATTAQRYDDDDDDGGGVLVQSRRVNISHACALVSKLCVGVRVFFFFFLHSVR